MLLLVALSAALGAPDQPRAGRSQPMQPVAASQDAPPPDMPQGTGPRATSGGASFDTVAVAQPDAGAHGVSAAANGATPGSFVELTELGSGHTVLALVSAEQAPAGVVLLSEGALQALGIAPGAGVRVRAALPSPQDQTALRGGGVASARIDAPEVLLKALRKRVPASPLPAAMLTRAQDVAPPTRKQAVRAAQRPLRQAEQAQQTQEPVPAPEERRPRPAPRAPAPALRSGYIVQVAALSAAARAEQLARTLGGRVVGGGGLYRVQLGPYGDLASANRARDGAARRGYRDARVAHTE